MPNRSRSEIAEIAKKLATKDSSWLQSGSAARLIFGLGMQLQFWTWKAESAVRTCGEDGAGLGTEQELSAQDRELLLDLAHRAITRVVTGETLSEVLGAFPGRLGEPHPCFVTLFKRSMLRGCVGNLLAETPLYAAVVRNAGAAAARDPRFEPVTATELPDLAVEISVLTMPRRLSFESEQDLLEQIQPHRHGVLLEAQSRVATFLPQVWCQIADKTQFLNRLAEKAGCAAGIWKTKLATISIYETESFHDEALLPHRN